MNKLYFLNTMPWISLMWCDDLLITIGIASPEKMCYGYFYFELEYVLGKMGMTI